MQIIFARWHWRQVTTKWLQQKQNILPLCYYNSSMVLTHCFLDYFNFTTVYLKHRSLWPEVNFCFIMSVQTVTYFERCMSFQRGCYKKHLQWNHAHHRLRNELPFLLRQASRFGKNLPAINITWQIKIIFKISVGSGFSNGLVRPTFKKIYVRVPWQLNVLVVTNW